MEEPNDPNFDEAAYAWRPDADSSDFLLTVAFDSGWHWRPVRQ